VILVVVVVVVVAAAAAAAVGGGWKDPVGGHIVRGGKRDAFKNKRAKRRMLCDRY